MFVCVCVILLLIYATLFAIQAVTKHSHTTV